MAQATFVKKARKDYPEFNIKKGESYWWWKFRFGGKHYSKTRPKPSQLTQSEYMGECLALQEEIDDLKIDPADLQAVVDELRSTADAIGESQASKIDNMPEGLQDGEVGQLLQSRADACEEVAGELDDAAQQVEDLIDPDMDPDDPAAPT